MGKVWLKLLQDYHQSLEDFNNESILTGDIKIAATQSISEYFITPILFDFKNQYKNIEIHFQTKNSKECLNLLRNGNIELAIIEAELDTILTKHDNLEMNLWKKDELIVATSDKKLSNKEFYIDELLNQQWILRESGSGLRDKFLNEIGVVSKQLNIFLELDRTTAIKELLLQKKAISVFSKKSIEKELQNSTLYKVKIKNINLKRNFYILKRKNYNFNRNLEKFEKILKKTYLYKS